MRSSNKVFDALLVLQCQSGNERAISLLVKRWHIKLCKQAYWYTNDIEVSKDIAQDSWSTIFLKINNLKDPDCFGSWALTIVTRKALDWYRKHSKEVAFYNEYKHQVKEKSTAINEEESIYKVLKHSIRALSQEQQIVLNLFYLEDYSIKEIGEIIQVPAGTVKSRLFKAREKLKLILKNKNYGQ
ncbi:RNA polymerase sigma factor [Aquimarina sp. 2201CG1-2-11]|uniref:RNA polymerase sigma factor n=1 Tax=Aquimarina discodermiae TaxID=3231043 RepID=UPI003461BC7B